MKHMSYFLFISFLAAHLYPGEDEGGEEEAVARLFFVTEESASPSSLQERGQKWSTKIFPDLFVRWSQARGWEKYYSNFISSFRARLNTSLPSSGRASFFTRNGHSWKNFRGNKPHWVTLTHRFLKILRHCDSKIAASLPTFFIVIFSPRIHFDSNQIHVTITLSEDLVVGDWHWKRRHGFCSSRWFLFPSPTQLLKRRITLTFAHIWLDLHPDKRKK